MKLNQKIILILILITAFFLRTHKISSFPAINSDEAAIGYNDYSLIQTGKDEHNVSWPLHFNSFGDYKPGGYFYLSLPFIKILGLNLLAVRLPNIILSILTIFFLYKLVALLSKNINLALISAAVLTFSPWHIHFSRGGWESSAALSFIVIGIYYFFKSMEERFLLNFSLFIISFVGSLYIYHSARIIAPLLTLSLFIIYFNFIKSKLPKIFIPILIGIILTIPVLFSFLNNGGTTRFNGVGITADKGPLLRSTELLNQHQSLNIINRSIDNKRVLYFISWVQKYTSHFDLNFLAINGDAVPRSKSPEVGQINLIDVPFLIIGIIFLLKSNIYNRKVKIFILSFLFISPLASSLTFQAPSALRALSMVIPLSILISLGIFSFIELISKNKFKNIFIFFLILIYIYNIAYSIDSYFFHYEKRYPTAWQYGFSELVPYLEKEKDKYDNVFVTNKYDQPYILFLFYSKYPPQLAQKQMNWTTADQFGFTTVNHLDKYTFEKINWNEIPSNSLVVSSDEIIPSEPIKIINFPNGQPGFKIYSKL